MEEVFKYLKHLLFQNLSLVEFNQDLVGAIGDSVNAGRKGCTLLMSFRACQICLTGTIKSQALCTKPVPKGRLKMSAILSTMTGHINYAVSHNLRSLETMKTSRVRQEKPTWKRRKSSRLED
ncbi:unnamed protein product [Xylocopa violacea]|uniref:Uncharacterized protein n=1 Tax=Xylocopa violacea TaxID=135666 RepID=A0ABP1NC57_XYLVO